MSNNLLADEFDAAARARKTMDEILAHNAESLARQRPPAPPPPTPEQALRAALFDEFARLGVDGDTPRFLSELWLKQKSVTLDNFRQKIHAWKTNMD
jgi:hypothetical protein